MNVYILEGIPVMFVILANVTSKQTNTNKHN